MEEMLMRVLTQVFRSGLILLIFIIAGERVSAQNTVTGTIVNEQGDVMDVVSILIKGSTNGGTSDKGRHYSISVPWANTILVFSSIGFIDNQERANKCSPKVDVWYR